MHVEVALPEGVLEGEPDGVAEVVMEMVGDTEPADKPVLATSFACTVFDKGIC